MNVSIVLPTKNGGTLLSEVLDAVAAQRYERGSLEVLAVDSGSRDGTWELLGRRGVRRHAIEPEEFDHGATRDLAISMASGEIVVLLVQDAVPVGEYWLDALTREFDDSEVAATYCRQLPRADAAALTAAHLSRYLAGRGERRRQCLAAGQDFAALTPLQRYELCAFDNVCSALRRSIWERIPFGRCAFAEDLRWARSAILAGHTIVYSPEAEVVHSHARSILYEYRRTYLAHHALYELFELCTAPRLADVWGSLKSSGESIAIALDGEPTLALKLRRALRAPVERTLSALAQYRGARAATLGRPAPRSTGI